MPRPGEKTHLGIRAIVVQERLLDLHALLRIAGRDGGVELVQLVEGQVGIELVRLLLVLLEVLEVLEPRHLGGVLERGQRRDVLGLMAPSEEGRHREGREGGAGLLGGSASWSLDFSLSSGFYCRRGGDGDFSSKDGGRPVEGGKGGGRPWLGCVGGGEC